MTIVQNTLSLEFIASFAFNDFLCSLHLLAKTLWEPRKKSLLWEIEEIQKGNSIINSFEAFQNMLQISPQRENHEDAFFCWCSRVSKNELNLNKVQINYLTASACQVRESGLVKVVLKSMLRKSLSLGSRLNSTNEGSDKRILTRWEVCHCLYVEIRSECSTNFWSLSGSLCQEWWMLPIFWTKIEIPKCFKAF